jgi:hypothetical protein
MNLKLSKVVPFFILFYCFNQLCLSQGTIMPYTFKQIKMDSSFLSKLDYQQDSIINHLIQIIEDTAITDEMHKYIKVQAVDLLVKQNNEKAINYLIYNIDKSFIYSYSDFLGEWYCFRALGDLNKWQFLSVLLKSLETDESISEFKYFLYIGRLDQFFKYPGDREILVSILNGEFQNHWILNKELYHANLTKLLEPFQKR